MWKNLVIDVINSAEYFKDSTLAVYYNGFYTTDIDTQVTKRYLVLHIVDIYPKDINNEAAAKDEIKEALKTIKYFDDITVIIWRNKTNKPVYEIPKYLTENPDIEILYLCKKLETMNTL